MLQKNRLLYLWSGMKVVNMWRMMGKAVASSKGQVMAKTDHWKTPAAPNDSSKSRSNPDISMSFHTL